MDFYQLIYCCSLFLIRITFRSTTQQNNHGNGNKHFQEIAHVSRFPAQEKECKNKRRATCILRLISMLIATKMLVANDRFKTKSNVTSRSCQCNVIMSIMSCRSSAHVYIRETQSYGIDFLTVLY